MGEIVNAPAPTVEDLAFLRQLEGRTKPATRKDVPFGSNRAVDRVRQRCSRNGWVRFGSFMNKNSWPVGWILTDAGAAALAATAQAGER